MISESRQQRMLPLRDFAYIGVHQESKPAKKRSHMHKITQDVHLTHLILNEYNECGGCDSTVELPRLRPACDQLLVSNYSGVFRRLAGSSAAAQETGSRWSVTSSQVVYFQHPLPPKAAAWEARSRLGGSKSQDCSIRRQPVARLIYKPLSEPFEPRFRGIAFPRLHPHQSL